MQNNNKNSATIPGRRKYRIIELLAKRFSETGESLPEQKKKLADKLNISYSQLNRIVNADEQGSPIDADKLVAISQHFDCELHEIINS